MTKEEIPVQLAFKASDQQVKRFPHMGSMRTKFSKSIRGKFTGPGVSFPEMFKYASKQEKLMTTIGILAAMLNGLPMALMLLVYGQTTDKFVTTQFCKAYEQYNVSTLCPPNVNQANINQMFHLCNWTGTNITVTQLANTVSRDSLIYTGIGIFIWVASWLQTTLLAYSGEKIVLDVRLMMFRAILLKPMSWYDRNDSGVINNHFTETMNKYKQGIGDKSGMIGQAILASIVSVVIILSLDWLTALVVLSLSPVFVVSAAYMTLLTMVSSDTETKAHQKASSVAQQAFSNIRTVHAFNGLDVLQQKYESHLDAAKAKAIKKGIINGLMLGLLWLVLFSSNALSFFYGSLRMKSGVTVGTILVIVFGMQNAVFSIGGALPHFQAVSDARAAAATIFRIIEGDDEAASSRNSFLDDMDSDEKNRLKKSTNQRVGILSSKPFNPNFNEIKFEKVHFSYPSRPDVKILDDVSFTIPKGSTVALVGESGSGKSTIAQLILGFYDIQSGTISIDNTSISTIDIAQFRSAIGLVSQEPVLFSTSIKENIRLGKADATDEMIMKACEIANAHEFIGKFPEGYDTEVGESGSQLSGGQKQRIAIARAIISNPQILLLDEATSALDSESEKQVQKALDVACEGRTTIIIAHRLSTIRNADTIIGMSRGRVVEMGSHDELMKVDGGVYKTLVMTQSSRHGELPTVAEEREELDEEFNDIEVFNDMRPKRRMTFEKAKLERTLKHRRHMTSTSSQVDETIVSTISLHEKDSSGMGTGKILWYLLKMNSPEVWFIVCGCLACMCFGVLQVIFEFFFAKMLFVYGHCNDVERQRIINRDSLTFLWIGISTGLAQAISSSAFTFSGEKLTKRLRQRVFRSLINQDMSFYDRDENSVGRLCTTLSTEASAVQGATGIRVGTTLSGLSILLVGVVIAFVFGWQLSLVILAFVPLLIISGVISMKIMAGFDSGDKKYLENAGRIIIETTSNIRVVKQLRQELYFHQKYEDNVTFVCKRNLKRTILTGFMFGFSQGIVFFAVAATYYAGAEFIDKGYISSEDFMLVFGTLLFGAMAVGQSQAMAPDYGKAVDAAKKVYTILSNKPKIDCRSQEGLTPSAFKGEIKFTDVKFSYPNRRGVRVLRNVTMQVSPNEKIALVGTSGCGKSTIIQLIQRFYDPTGGNIMLDGQNIKDLNLSWYRSQLGIVSQEPTMFDWSISENIAFGDTTRHVSMDEITAAAKAANIHKFITQLPEGYETSVGTKGSLISGGQKQRMCIARAIVRNPALLLLDEATSALDTESEKIVQEAVDAASADRSSISIAHRLTTIEKSDNIYVFDDGRIVEKGSHVDLLRDGGLYFNLYQLSKR